uniref:Kinetochore protein NUF2 n=1 Tax=Lygus hesperus TaxID=30085 RepID=A0A146M679_LYGHE
MAQEQRVLEEVKGFFDDFAINLLDLQKPTYVFVRDFYCRALMEFEIDSDNIRKSSHLLEGTDHTVEITGDLNLVSAINNTFNFLQFGLFDLLSPGDNQKRTVSMVSNVMEFLVMADKLTMKLDFESYGEFREQINEQAKQVEAMRQKLSEIALAKDKVLQATIAMKNELAKSKIKEQQVCTEADAAVKEANTANIKLEEKQAILKAKKAQVDQLKNAISTLKEELAGAQSLEVKEEERKKAEQEKMELQAKYMEKVAAKKKYVAALEINKSIAAEADGLFALVDEVGNRQEELLSIQKETSDMSHTVLIRKKELSPLENEAVEVEKKTKQIEADGMKIKEEYRKNIEIQDKKASELVESIGKIEGKVAECVINLDALKMEADQADSMYLEVFNQFQSYLRKG